MSDGSLLPVGHLRVRLGRRFARPSAGARHVLRVRRFGAGAFFGAGALHARLRLGDHDLGNRLLSRSAQDRGRLGEQARDVVADVFRRLCSYVDERDCHVVVSLGGPPYCVPSTRTIGPNKG